MTTKPLSQEAMERLQKMTEFTTLLMAVQSIVPISHSPFSLYFNFAPSLAHVWPPQ